MRKFFSSKLRSRSNHATPTHLFKVLGEVSLDVILYDGRDVLHATAKFSENAGEGVLDDFAGGRAVVGVEHLIGQELSGDSVVS